MRHADLKVVEAPDGSLFVDFCGQRGCNMHGCACWADHGLREMRAVAGPRREEFLAGLYELGRQAAAEGMLGL